MTRILSIHLPEKGDLFVGKHAETISVVCCSNWIFNPDSGEECNKEQRQTKGVYILQSKNKREQ